MKGTYILTDKKLSDEEFKEKYYVKGFNEQQFHTMDLDDGIDERQQLLINNDRALFEIMTSFNRIYLRNQADRVTELKRIKKEIRIATAIAVAAAILNVLTLCYLK